jgi:hypothetical protein
MRALRSTRSTPLLAALLSLLSAGAIGAEPIAAEAAPVEGERALRLFAGPLGALVSADVDDPSAGGPGSPAGLHIAGADEQAGPGWWALICDSGCRLQDLVLEVRPALHESYDGEPVPSQLLHWVGLPPELARVPAATPEGAAQVLAVFKPQARGVLARLKVGPLPTRLHSGLTDYPASRREGTLETRLLEADNSELLLVPVLQPAPDPDAGDYERLSLELRRGAQRQSLGDFEITIEGVVPIEPRVYLPWAGDLDGDGRSDLLVRLGEGQVRLYLSSLAADGEILGLAGEFSYYDPSWAGC